MNCSSVSPPSDSRLQAPLSSMILSGISLSLSRCSAPFDGALGGARYRQDAAMRPIRTRGGAIFERRQV